MSRTLVETRPTNEEAATASGTLGAFRFIRRIGFPSTVELVSILSTMVLLSTTLSLPITGSTVTDAVLAGLTLILLPSILGELVAALVILRDRVLDFRRLLGLELVSWAPLIIVLPISALIQRSILPTRQVWLDGILLVLALSLTSRFLTSFSLSHHPMPRRILAVLPPLILTGGIMIVQYPAQTLHVLVTLVLLTTLIAFMVKRFVTRIDHEGASEIGARPMSLFRGFVEHWLDKNPSSLEEQLIPLGTKETIETTILGFFGRGDRRKGAIVISNFHPGPYRDLGSSGLPARLKLHLEKNIGGTVHVPHAISGHKSNVISSNDMEKLLELCVKNYPSSPRTSVSTRLVRENHGVASSTGQLFDSTALLTLTMSPNEMEDIPTEVLQKVSSAASQRGLRAILVDSHNSITVQTQVGPEQAKQLETAAVASLDRVVKSDQYGFKTGFAQDPLLDFGLEDGIGPGGVSVLTVKANDQLVAYVTVDGNNMRSGFREQVLESLRELDVVDGEIMTTDTHLVTGLVRSRLGYHPVGGTSQRDFLRKKIKETTRHAIRDLEDSSVGISSFGMEARVLGSDAFQTITGYIGRMGRRVRNLFYVLEPVSAIVTLLVLMLT